ncbi:cytochrome c oxidase accessory protein ccog [Sulfuricella denitrificans skB26]|uniref:Cytochrome c oxidase accessory protein ccog n=2 Tax=Sulfuricella denitrificans TaxID=649841 RepID=S6AB12_SULDS|nr:cytochrome c oxidase accessory protein ccog [Sulfuricella denitrificans skB26]
MKMKNLQAGENSEELFQKRIPIYPRSVKGTFRTFKTSVLVLAYAVYFLLPWLPWARHDAPAQAVLFDMVGRRFFIFDLVFYPQDLISLSLLMFIAAALLFFTTGLVGRAFCGYFCFQTLWTDAFIFIEKWVQGERPARIRLHKQPWNAEKVAKYGATHGLWLLLAFITAYSFIMYFGYAPELTQRFFTVDLPFVAYFTVLILTVTTYVAAALAREQVCIYMCPYARFQGVMYEPETLAPYYDLQRGEGTAGRAVPRAGSKTREERHAKGIGDCIDCGFCVQVCPAGIDIRKGLQYQCISCGLCVDACNNIMDSVGYPKGLIRYDSEINIESKNPGKPHLDWLRLRTLGYGVAILVMVGLLVYNITSRSEIELSIQPVRQPLFVVLSNGDIRNRYQIHITNKSQDVQEYRISVHGIPEGAVDLGEMSKVSVRQGKSLMVLANVKLPPAMVSKVSEIEFVITPLKNPDQAVIKKVRFYAKHEG